MAARRPSSYRLRVPAQIAQFRIARIHAVRSGVGRPLGGYCVRPALINQRPDEDV